MERNVYLVSQALVQTTQQGTASCQINSIHHNISIEFRRCIFQRTEDSRFTNIPAESIAWLCDNCRAPLFVDPVSTVKATKLKGLLGKLHTLKPNRIEAELLSGVEIRDEDSLRRAADVLLSTGLHRVFISLGADGVYAADRITDTRVHLPVIPGEMVNTTGCGDAFMAAITWAYLRGTDLEETTRLGLAASTIAMESTATINPAMSADAVLQRSRVQDNK